MLPCHINPNKSTTILCFKNKQQKGLKAFADHKYTITLNWLLGNGIGYLVRVWPGMSWVFTAIGLAALTSQLTLPNTAHNSRCMDSGITAPSLESFVTGCVYPGAVC